MPIAPEPYKPEVVGSLLALIAGLARGYRKNVSADRAKEFLLDIRQGCDELLKAQDADRS